MGAAGQRCMAISAAVFVGGMDQWAGPLLQRAQNLNLGPGYQKGIDVGPLISPEAKARCERLIASAEQQVIGASITAVQSNIARSSIWTLQAAHHLELNTFCHASQILQSALHQV